MKQRRNWGDAPPAFSRPSPEPSSAARPREGIGSSSGRVAAALRQARVLREGAASPDLQVPETAEQTFARLQLVYAARKERELLFEQQAQRLEALLFGTSAP